MLTYNPDVIRSARKRAGLSQQRLGEIIGLPSRQAKIVSRWECGEYHPTADYLLRIMAALDLTPSDFA